ncbi:hypothetical protein BU23DRAFT_571669 [Bimuria novae-zelandiae CBS 107.79]|uniref:Uncharacterized protein n=1 Tax=Bimuria novae-zelandiae CBS 107.79 TaxID=1447943 RepID=A0A6A5UZB6_9PLEO|nr:hypothetical protein BU23DRAFT_571669 [Bimuria novae-zelandiae CBS 107.79]
MDLGSRLLFRDWYESGDAVEGNFRYQAISLLKIFMFEFTTTTPGRYIIMTFEAFVILLFVIWFFWRHATTWERFRHLFKGRAMIEERTKNDAKSPFSLPVFGFGGRVHSVSSEKHMAELSKAPQDRLSIHAWGGESIVTKTETSPPVRSAHHGNFTPIGRLSSYQLLKRRSRKRTYVELDFETLGEDLAYNGDFVSKGLAYSRQAKVISELAKLLPSSIIGYGTA